MREYLKRLREEKGLSQNDVAIAIDMRPNYYSMIEAGLRKQKMDIQTMSKLARALNVDIEVIISNELKNTG